MAKLREHLRKIRHNLPILRSFYAKRRKMIASIDALRQENESSRRDIETLRQEIEALRQEIETSKLMTFAVSGNHEAIKRLEKRVDNIQNGIVDGS